MKPLSICTIVSLCCVTVLGRSASQTHQGLIDITRSRRQFAHFQSGQNRDVATELGLSEHTVKKYLFRIFETLGISNRVELVLYAVHHGVPQQPEWIASA